MNEPEIKLGVDEHGNIECRVTNEGVLLTKAEKEFIAIHILHLFAENARLQAEIAKLREQMERMVALQERGGR